MVLLKKFRAEARLAGYSSEEIAGVRIRKSENSKEIELVLSWNTNSIVSYLSHFSSLQNVTKISYRHHKFSKRVLSVFAEFPNIERLDLTYLDMIPSVAPGIKYRGVKILDFPIFSQIKQLRIEKIMPEEIDIDLSNLENLQQLELLVKPRLNQQSLPVITVPRYDVEFLRIEYDGEMVFSQFSSKLRKLDFKAGRLSRETYDFLQTVKDRVNWL